jgi:isoleucyl-tRNA synthetase
MFEKVDPKQPLPKMEEEIVKFWEENKIFEKSLEKTRGKPPYVFYDGPPFATGTPHYGHILTSVIKDVIPRYQTMKGRYVERIWGWDCHGLPIENIVEQELKIKRKKDIKKLGVDKFNETCRSKVLRYTESWKRIIKRLGRWVDMDNAYKTMDLSYMESVWWAFKELWKKGLIYEGYRSMHICTRCETTLSQQEVAEGYKNIKDLAVTVKFKLLANNERTEANGSVYLLAWTTTPWTLIGNVALAVGKNIDYVKFELKNHPDISNGIYITSVRDFEEHKKRGDVRIIEKVKGSKLVGKEYQPLFNYYLNKILDNEENGWKIYPADFVTTEEGTGIVHIAPAFGEDDLNLGNKYKLPFIQHVGMDGLIRKEAVDFAGLSVKPQKGHQETDSKVVEYLEKNNLLFIKEEYEHSYPHCWRCETPLINYATSSWFVNVTKIKEKAIKLAKKINWSPAHIKEGRFGKWLEGARDWSISRQRFWASVIPIWRCDRCSDLKVIGSVGELEKLSEQKITDLHKHIIDKITFRCEKCPGEMRRVSDVLDCWFESGSMPYAQLHYPFENKDKFDKNFPAEFIGEGVDQTRAWFYYLHIIAAAIKGKPAYKNVIANGIILAEDGKKMSKRLKNYPDPDEIMEKYGADALRLYLLSSPVVVAENLNFKESEVKELVKGMLRMLWNSYSFFVLYANIDGWKPLISHFPFPTSNLLDKWIVSELNVLIKEVAAAMESYELNRAVRLFPKFVDNLSNWYIRRSRRRFWKSENDEDKNEAYRTLHYVLVELSKLLAPFAPFVAEEIYKNLIQPTTNNQQPTTLSVHLADFPEADEKIIDADLNKKMEKVREIVSLGLQLRAKAGIKVRQPLSELRITNYELQNEFLDIIKEEVNVKEVVLEKGKGSKIELDTEITEDLKQEGQAREIIRHIQEMRKEAGYEVDNRIIVCYNGQSEVFRKFGVLIAKETLADELKAEKLENADLEKEFKIKIEGEKVKIQIIKK